MKKILSFILVAILCLGAFVACSPDTPAATLDDAKTYLANMYKDSATDLKNDYDLVGKVIISGVTFTVEWTVDVSEITIKASDKESFWTVDLPDANATEKAYVLTATIKDAEGATTTVTLNRKLPVYEKVAGVVTNPVAETPYKLFFKQANIGKTLFLTAEDTGKFIKTTIDPKAAPDFYVEVVDGGVKIYTTVNGAKAYLTAAATLGSDGKVSKSITYGNEGSVFTYNKEINAWYTVVDNIKYCMGTYNTYDTVSISEDSYFSAENTGVSQFPVEFISKADGEAMAPTEGPKDPTELTSIPDAVAIGAAKDHNTYTVEKYLVKGTITEIPGAQYGNMYIEDEEGNSIYIYGLYSSDGSVRFDAMNPQPKVGDVITVMSVIGQYNDTPQLKNAWLMKLEAVECEHTYTAACDATCNKCGATRTADEHTYDNACDTACNVCNETRTTEHVYDNACDATCNVCAATREVAGHVYTDECKAACSVCEAVNEAAEHQYDDVCDVVCNVCNAERTAPHKYTSDCDTTCDLCSAKRATTAEHKYDYDCDKDCNVCSETRAVECVDADTDGICDICENEMPNQSDVESSHITYERELISFDVIKENTTLVLPATGTEYTDVTITWTAENATITDGKITVTVGDVEQTISLTAVFACGDTTATANYTVKVAAHVYDNACDAKCNDCEATRTPADHVYDNVCDADCNVCNASRTPAEHVDADKNGKCDNCNADVDVNIFPEIGVAYKLFVYQGNNFKNLYFTGEMANTYYFGSTEVISDGVDIFFEVVDGGYNMYFTKDGTKNYISIVASGTHINAVYSAEDGTRSVFTYDETYNTMVTVVNDESYYIGTYGTYNTLSPSKIEYAATSFVGHFVKQADATTCMHEFATSCASTCYYCGSNNTNISHNYADATCTTPKTCVNCKETDGDALGHHYVDGVCDREGCGANEPAGNETTVSISFADTANRTSQDEDSQVWEQNGIKVTNSQGSSTNSVADYSNPVRFYKSSTVTIECTGMLSITFYVDDYKETYPTDLASSITTGTVSTNGYVVTVNFSSPVDSFTIDKLAGQVRVDSITIVKQ